MLASPDDETDGHCAYFVMVGLWSIRARSLYKLCNWEMKDEQSSAVCVFGEGVTVYSIKMATAPDRWETCPDVEALQLRHKSPGKWCHNGSSDEKFAVSKKKSDKQISWGHWCDSDVPLPQPELYNMSLPLLSTAVFQWLFPVTSLCNPMVLTHFPHPWTTPF